MSAPIQSFYSFNNKTYCEPCVWKGAREAKDAGQPSEYVPLHDYSVCAYCGADNGETEFPVFGKLALCPNCAPKITNWPYPQWLKISLAALLALLIVALAHGRKYFQAGWDMYVAERLVSHKHYAEAVARLKKTLEVAPQSDKATLLMIKAGVLSEDLAAAQKAIHGHNNGKFEDADSDEFREANAMWNRASSAYDKYDEGSKLLQQEGHDAEAARLLREAAGLYPESAGIEFMAEYAEEGAAFDRKDYDAFASIAEKLWKGWPSSNTAAGLASALACKYVTTGNGSYRMRAEEMLAKAQEMAQSDAEAQKQLPEYVERIRYRIDKKDIINKQEYDRRFRQKPEKN